MLIMQIISKATQKCQKPDENNQTTELYWQKLSKEINHLMKQHQYLTQFLAETKSTEKGNQGKK